MFRLPTQIRNPKEEQRDEICEGEASPGIRGNVQEKDEFSPSLLTLDFLDGRFLTAFCFPFTAQDRKYYRCLMDFSTLTAL